MTRSHVKRRALRHGLGRLDAAPRRIVALTPQLTDEELLVDLRVLDEKQAKLLSPSALGVVGACSLSRSQ